MQGNKSKREWGVNFKVWENKHQHKKHWHRDARGSIVRLTYREAERTATRLRSETGDDWNTVHVGV